MVQLLKYKFHEILAVEAYMLAAKKKLIMGFNYFSEGLPLYSIPFPENYFTIKIKANWNIRLYYTRVAGN